MDARCVFERECVKEVSFVCVCERERYRETGGLRFVTVCSILEKLCISVCVCKCVKRDAEGENVFE